jgi:hypothetical protein
MDVCMSGNPLDGIPAYNRVSIRAVLVHGDEDPGPALAAAGITDPIAIPVVMGEDLDLFGGMLGDGITPNLTAVLETEAREDFGYSSTDRSDQTDSQPDAARPASPFTTTAPLAFGMRSFAPIGRLGDTRSGRYGNNTTGFPPSPGESLEIDRILTSGRRNLYPSAGHGSVSTVEQNGATTEGDPDTAGQGTANEGVAAQPSDGRSVPEPNSTAGDIVSSVADPTSTAGESGPSARAGNGPIRDSHLRERTIDTPMDSTSYDAAKRTIVGQLSDLPSAGDDGNGEAGATSAGGGSTAGRGVQMAARDPKLDYLARQMGIGRFELRDAIHVLKDKAGLGGADNVVINASTGDVTFGGASIGNIFDE